MSIFNSVGTPLVVLMIILMIGGAIFGTAVSDAGYLNPDTSKAKAERMNADTTHALAVYEQEERILQAQTDTQIAKLNTDSNAYQEQTAQNLAHQKEMQLLEWQSYQRMAAAKEQFVIIVGYGLNFGVILAAILLAGSRILLVMRSTKSQSLGRAQGISPAINPAPASLEPWRLPEYKHQMIKQARENERAFLQAIKDGKVNSSNHGKAIMTKEKYLNLPLAQ